MDMMLLLFFFKKNLIYELNCLIHNSKFVESKLSNTTNIKSIYSNKVVKKI